MGEGVDLLRLLWHHVSDASRPAGRRARRACAIMPVPSDLPMRPLHGRRIFLHELFACVRLTLSWTHTGRHGTAG